MSRWPGVFVVVAALVTGASVLSQDAPVAKLEPRQSLRASAWCVGDPGGMLFHTAFHQGITTRFLLLKTVLRSEDLAKYLSIDEPQRLQIKELRPLKVSLDQPRGVTDQNAQPDEQIVQPDYFDFLRPEQLKRLDTLAFRFDGYAALTRKSLANAIELSDASRQQVAKAVSEVRETWIVPRVRANFAAPLPDDQKFRDCYFAGGVTAQLNLRVIDILTDNEIQGLYNLLSTALESEAATAVERLAPLPEGIARLNVSLK